MARRCQARSLAMLAPAPNTIKHARPWWRRDETQRSLGNHVITPKQRLFQVVRGMEKEASMRRL